MAHLVLCEPTELYNILNQVTKLSRLIEPNYLCLLDVRPKREYDESHVITAHRVKKSGDRYLIPESVDLECVRYCVVYDSNTSSLKAKPKARDSAEKWEEEEEVEKEEEVKEEEEEEEKEEEEKEEGEKEEGEEEGAENIRQDLAFGDAVQCGRSLSHLTRHPVQILKGGYQRFSAMYHFLRTQKVIWMPQELDAFMPYPVEIVPGKIYMGDFKQACDPKVQKNLKIKAHVNVCMETGPFFEGDADRLLHIRIQDSPEANILPFLRHACHFLEIHLELGSVILVFSTQGISRSSAIVVAFLMHSREQTLKRSWDYVLKCQNNMCLSRNLVAQLSQWEKIVLGDIVTDISNPRY